MPKKIRKIWKLPPQYSIFLNPYENERFGRCPQCGAKMRQRKLPLAIHVDPLHPICLNYTCRYCQACDLLIAHQNEIEHLLIALLEQHAPQAIGNDYLVLGTVDHDFWMRGTKAPHTVQGLVDNLHDLKQVLTFKPAYGWIEKGKPSGKRLAPPARERRLPKVALRTSHIDNPDSVKDYWTSCERICLFRFAPRRA